MADGGGSVDRVPAQQTSFTPPFHLIPQSYAMKSVHFALGRLPPALTVTILSCHCRCGCSRVRRADIRLAPEITGCTEYIEPWEPCLEAWEVTHGTGPSLGPAFSTMRIQVSHQAGQSLVSWLLFSGFPTPSCDCCPYCIQSFSFLFQFSQG